MRRILIDKARQKANRKRGREMVVEELHESQIEMTAPAEEILAVHGALEALFAEEPRPRKWSSCATSWDDDSGNCRGAGAFSAQRRPALAICAPG